MLVQLRCDGVPIGSAELPAAAGLAHAPIDAAPGHALVAYAVREATLALARVELWRAVDGDFAEEFARRWAGGRLALVDERGVELAIASLAVVERPTPGTGERRPWLVADFRPDLARIEALLRTLDRDDGGRSRPAA